MREVERQGRGGRKEAGGEKKERARERTYEEEGVGIEDEEVGRGERAESEG